MRNRFKSPVLYTAIGAVVIYIVKMCGGIDCTEEVSGLLDVLLPALALLGIVNNPQSSDSL